MAMQLQWHGAWSDEAGLSDAAEAEAERRGGWDGEEEEEDEEATQIEAMDEESGEEYDEEVDDAYGGSAGEVADLFHEAADAQKAHDTQRAARRAEDGRNLARALEDTSELKHD